MTSWVTATLMGPNAMSAVANQTGYVDSFLLHESESLGTTAGSFADSIGTTILANDDVSNATNALARVAWTQKLFDGRVKVSVGQHDLKSCSTKVILINAAFDDNSLALIFVGLETYRQLDFPSISFEDDWYGLPRLTHNCAKIRNFVKPNCIDGDQTISNRNSGFLPLAPT